MAIDLSNKKTTISDKIRFDSDIARDLMTSFWHALAPIESHGRDFYIDLCRQLNETIITHSALTNGQIILNVSNDMGETLRSIINRFGGRVRVINFDSNFNSLKEVQRRLHPTSLNYFIAGDLDALPFVQQCFDRVISRFGLEMVDDLPQSLTTLYNLLKPEGLISLVTLDQPDKSPVFNVVIEQLQQFCPELVPGGIINVFKHRKLEGMPKQLDEIGFRGLRIFERTVSRRIPVGAHVWLSEVMLFLGHYVITLSASQRKQFINNVVAGLEPYRRGRNYIIENKVQFITAIR